jgi:hypothetical protein
MHAHVIPLSVVMLLGLAMGCDSNASRPPVAAKPPVVVPSFTLTPEQRTENPVYTRWAKFAVGSRVRLQETIESAGKTIGTATVTYTVTERGEGFVVVETQRTSQHTDGTPPSDHTQPLKHYQWMTKSNDKDPFAPAGTYEHGAEQLTQRGKTYATTWYKYKGRVEAGETLSHAWYAVDVPGGLVKLDYSIPKTKSSIRTELVEITIPEMK